MADPAGVSKELFPPLYPQTAGSSVQLICEHPLSRIDPRCLELPGPNWGFCKIHEKSLIICELMMPTDPSAPRIRKHVHVNLTNGVCTSYVLDRKISEIPSVTRIDVERCIEELHMMHVCVGGPAASRYPPALRTNSRVDAFGNWRHNSCKIVAAWTGLPCNACESLQYELNELARTSKLNKSNDVNKPKRVVIGNLSHRKQSQIISLRKRRQSWYRKKKIAEKEMKSIEDMIAEVSEEPDENDGTNYGNEDDEDDDE